MHSDTRSETEYRPRMSWRGVVAGYTCLILLGLCIFAASSYAARPPVRAQGGRTPCATLSACHRALAWQRLDRRHLRHQLSVRWHPSVVTAIELASRVSGVSFARLWTISGCESTHNPQDTLGQYRGLFQLGAYHRSLPDIVGLNAYDPYVNAMHAALFIARNGESQWACRSDGHVAY